MGDCGVFCNRTENTDTKGHWLWWRIRGCYSISAQYLKRVGNDVSESLLLWSTLCADAASICIETIGPRGHIIRVFKVESFIRFRSSQEDNGRTPVVPILSSVVSDKHNSKKKTISTTGQATSPCLKGALLHAAETEIWKTSLLCTDGDLITGANPNSMFCTSGLCIPRSSWFPIFPNRDYLLLLLCFPKFPCGMVVNDICYNFPFELGTCRTIYGSTVFEVANALRPMKLGTAVPKKA
jgi:hypothetical protein